LAIFGGGGGLLSALVWKPCKNTGFMSCFMEPGSRGDAFALGLVVGTVVAIPVGILWGLKKKAVWEEVWEGAPIGAPAPFLFVPKDGGLGFGAVIPIGR